MNMAKQPNLGNVVSRGTPREKALNDLRAGVESYVHTMLGENDAWLSVSVGMDFDGRSYNVSIQDWLEAEKEQNIKNHIGMLIGEVRSHLASPDNEGLDRLIMALQRYDAARHG